MKKKFLKYYPIVNMLYNLSFFIQRVCYLYDKTEYFNPWFRLIGLRIQRMTMEDYVKIFLFLKYIYIYLKYN